ncbi:uncharacterized protein METZ01_LOCUS247215, partial [marine metagenome]
ILVFFVSTSGESGFCRQNGIGQSVLLQA